MRFGIHKENGPYVAYIEIDEDENIWNMEVVDTDMDAPIAVEIMRKKKLHPDKETVKMFVRSRLVPPDRQNITDILYNMGLTTYSIVDILLRTSGRCDSDEFIMTRV